MKLTLNAMSRRQTGLSLVELMVSLVISTLILSGVMQIFISSKKSYSTEEELARMQENARYAVRELSKDVRLTGFAGCSGSSTSAISPSIKAIPTTPASHFVDGRSVVGFDNNDGGTLDLDGDGSADISSVVAGTDAFLINSAAECSSQVLEPMASRTDPLIVSDMDSCGWEEDDYAIVTDCVGMDVFKVSGASVHAMGYQISHAGTQNSKSKFSTKYDQNSAIFSFSNTLYYISIDSDSGRTGLFRKVNDNDAELIVDGVEDMQVRFGRDSDGDYVVDELLSASALSSGSVSSTKWEEVITLELNLLMVSEADGLLPASQTFTFNGIEYDSIEDTRIRHVVRQTVSMRSLSL